MLGTVIARFSDKNLTRAVELAVSSYLSQSTRVLSNCQVGVSELYQSIFWTKGKGALIYYFNDGFLANVNVHVHVRYMLSPVRLSSVCLSVCLSSVRLSVVCNVRASYSGGSDFRQYFYGIRYLGHPWTSTGNFTEIVPGEPLHRGS